MGDACPWLCEGCLYILKRSRSSWVLWFNRNMMLKDTKMFISRRPIDLQYLHLITGIQFEINFQIPYTAF